MVNRINKEENFACRAIWSRFGTTSLGDIPADVAANPHCSTSVLRIHIGGWWAIQLKCLFPRISRFNELRLILLQSVRSTKTMRRTWFWSTIAHVWWKLHNYQRWFMILKQDHIDAKIAVFEFRLRTVNRINEPRRYLTSKFAAQLPRAVNIRNTMWDIVVDIYRSERHTGHCIKDRAPKSRMQNVGHHDRHTVSFGQASFTNEQLYLASPESIAGWCFWTREEWYASLSAVTARVLLVWLMTGDARTETLRQCLTMYWSCHCGGCP